MTIKEKLTSKNSELITDPGQPRKILEDVLDKYGRPSSVRAVSSGRPGIASGVGRKKPNEPTTEAVLRSGNMRLVVEGPREGEYKGHLRRSITRHRGLAAALYERKHGPEGEHWAWMGGVSLPSQAGRLRESDGDKRERIDYHMGHGRPAIYELTQAEDGIVIANPLDSEERRANMGIPDGAVVLEKLSDFFGEIRDIVDATPVPSDNVVARTARAAIGFANGGSNPINRYV